MTPFSGRTVQSKACPQITTPVAYQSLSPILPAVPTLQTLGLWTKLSRLSSEGEGWKGIHKEPTHCWQDNDMVLSLFVHCSLSPACPPVQHMSIHHIGSPHTHISTPGPVLSPQTAILFLCNLVPTRRDSLIPPLWLTCHSLPCLYSFLLYISNILKEGFKMKKKKIGDILMSSLAWTVKREEFPHCWCCGGLVPTGHTNWPSYQVARS